MPSKPDAGPGRYLHPATLLFTLGGQVKALLIPALAVLVLASGSRWEFWLLAMFVPAVAYQILRYLTLTYRFTSNELIVRQGLVFRSERHIPFGRIQNVDLSEGPIHRILGVADVRLQTGSGSEPEAELRVLSLAAVEQMRERIFAGRRETPETPEELDPDEARPTPRAAGRTLAELTPGELVLLGVITFRGLVLVSVAVGFAFEFDLFDRIRIDPDEVMERFSAAGPPRWVLVLAAGLGALILLLALSIAWTVLRFFGYRLERAGDDLRIRCGLLTRVSATVPRRRIQFISVRESVVHRLFGYVAVRVETAGGGEGEDDVSRKWFIPLLKRGRLPEVLGELRPGMDLGDADWRPLAPRALRRKLPLAMTLSVAVSAATAPVIGWWAVAVGLVLVPWAVGHAVLWVRSARYAVVPEGVAYRSGVLTHARSVTFFDKMQVLSVSASPFDRRHHMATFAVDTAGAGPAGHVISIPYLERERAGSLLEELSARTEEAVFHW